MDYWNLWDGMCFDSTGKLWFIQIKTNQWPVISRIEKWLESKTGISCMAINVHKQEVQVRIFKSEENTI